MDATTANPSIPEMPKAHPLHVVGQSEPVAGRKGEPDAPVARPRMAEANNDAGSPQSDQKSRSAIEGCLKTGAVMKALFPDGLELKSEGEFAVFRLLDRVVGSLAHFAETGMEHRTSMRDIATYTALIDAVLSTREDNPS
jgi:hypothetical protein